MRSVWWLATLLLGTATAIRWSGACGDCLFENATHREPCMDIKWYGQRLFSGGSRTTNMLFEKAKVCLKYFRTNPDDPDDKNEYITTVSNSVYDPFFGELGAGERFMPRLEFVNLVSYRGELSIMPNPQGSSFALVKYVTQLDKNYYGHFAAAPWFKVDWPQRDATVIFVQPSPDMGRNNDIWETDACKAFWPGCFPDAQHWGQWLINGRKNEPDPAGPSPVMVSRVWCAKTGINDNQADCGPAMCNGLAISCGGAYDPQNEWYCGGGTTKPWMNKCTNSGYCRCNARFGGADCSVRLDNQFVQSFNQAKLPQAWRYDDESCASPECCAKRSQASNCGDRPNWSFWNCSVYDPCSGSGRCIDPEHPWEIPTCECYPGYFGSKLSEIDAYGRALFCTTLGGSTGN